VTNFNKQSSAMCGYFNHSLSKMADFFSSKILRLFLCLHLIISPFTIIAQTSQDSRLKIDSLKNVVPHLHDSLRIDCLNELSIQFTRIEKKDSAMYYADKAFAEAKKLNYNHGIAVSFVRKSRIVKHFDDDFIQSEALAREALRWYEKTLNKKNIYDVYYELEYSVFAQSRYSEAIEYAQKMYEWSKENNDELSMLNALSSIPSIYKSAGNYEKSFEYSQQLHQQAVKANNKIFLSSSLFQIGELYMKIDDYLSALSYYRRAFQMDDRDIVKARIAHDWDIWVKMEYAEIFSHLNQFDSARHYFELYKPAKKDDRYFRVYLVSIGEYYFLQKKYVEALQNFLPGLYYHKKLNDRNEIQRTLLFIAETYLALNKNDSALQYGKEGLSLAFQTKAKQIIRDGYQVLYTVYDRQHKTDSANFYFRKYAAIKDTVLNDQLKAKFASYGYQQRIELIGKEKQLQQQQLKQTAQQKRFLLTGIAAIFILGVILFRNILLKRKNDAHLREIAENELQLQKVESEKTKAELQQQSTELEMQALRAQMNPHFIFNSLNSINRFILQNNKAQASEYLTKFSRLVRLILQNSQSALIPLESELESLQLYLELEAVRFDHHFEFNIKVDDELETDVIKVPPLIIQPYAENAIWHGLMHKEEKGHLEIELFQQFAESGGDEMLCCKITDDGVGRKKAAEIKSKSASTHKSMGMQITASRIEMLQQKKQLDAYIKITDLVLADGSAGGTEVILKIPIMQ
jgi:tetratricopeptide (TPR) repeat protein